MKSLYNFYPFLIFVFHLLFSANITAQNITLSFERDLNDIDYFEGTFDSYSGEAILHTSQGFALYYGSERTGLDNYVKLRNNHTIIWKTQVDKFPDNITPVAFHEHESGYFFVGDFNLSSGTGGIGRLNKTTGNIEVKKSFTDLNGPNLRCLHSTHANNLIVGGNIYNGGGLDGIKGLIRVVDVLGNTLVTKTSNNTGGLWGNIVNQITKTNDNGYIISGIIYENTICGEPNNTSWWIAKLNGNLDVVWSRKYGNDNGTTIARKVIVLPGNDIVVLGSTYCTNGNGGGVNNTGEGTWLVKLDVNGNLLKHTFIGVNFLDYTKSYTGIDKSCDGQLVLAGTVGGLLGTSYFIEKFDTNLEYIENTSSLFGLSQEKNFSRIGVQLGIDKSYLIYGLFEMNAARTSFVAKTIPDDACGSTPNPLLCETSIGAYSVCENFDKLQTGNLLPQGSPKFSLYSGSAGENATVTKEKAFSGHQSLKFTATSDIDFNIDRTIQSPSRIEWMTYMEAGKTGSWGLETSSPSVYGLVVNMNNGSGTLYTMSSSSQFDQRATFTYTAGQWFKTALVFNNTDKTIETWINDKMIYSRPNHTSGQITDLNIYATPGSSNNLFYIDDLLYYETNVPCICTSEYNPVCVNTIEYSNACRAGCAGYTPSEWKSGPCGGSPPSREITLDLDDNICGSTNSEVKVPVKVKDYSDIAGLEIRIASSNENIAEIIGVADIHPNSGIVSVDFAVVNKKLVLTYADMSKSLPDGTTLFTVRVLLKGNINSTANLVFEGESKALDNNFGKIGVVTMNGSVCVNQSVYSISGNIANSKSKGVKDVLVNYGTNQTTKTNSNGDFNISNLANNNYTIKPSLDEKLDNGVDITDLLLMRRHLQGLTLFSNPLTFVAADLNVDKIIDIGDLLLIRRIIQGLTTQLPNGRQAWRFIPKSYTFPTSDPLSGSIPDVIQINALNANQTNQNFVGVKYADLDHSLIPAHEIKTENRNLADVELNIQSQTASSGKVITVEIRCKNFIKGAVMQFSLQWPTNQLELQGVPAGNNIVIPGTTLFDQTQLSSGKLGFIWETDNLANGTTLADNSVIYRLSYKVLAPNGQNVVIQSSVTPKPAKFLNSDVNEVPLKINPGNITVMASTASHDINSQKIILYPNPTTGFTSLNLPKFVTCKEVQITDMKGLVLHVPADNGKIDLTGFSTGLYLIQFVSGGQLYEGKIIKID